MRGLKDKVAIITGAAGGIGRSLVQRFLEEGARVAALDLNQAGLDEIKGQFQQYAGQLTTAQLDITDHDAVAKAVQKIHADLKQIDILVNNAGWDAVGQFVDSAPELWDKLIAINLKGPLNLQHAVAPLMIAAGGGKIVNIASDAGRVGSSGEAVYSACKGGIIAFTSRWRAKPHATACASMWCALGRPIPHCCAPLWARATTARKFTTVSSGRFRSSD